MCHPRPSQESRKDQIRSGEGGLPCSAHKTDGISPPSEPFFVCIVHVLVMLVCAYACAGDKFLCMYVETGGHWLSLFPRERFLPEPRIRRSPGGCIDPVSVCVSVVLGWQPWVLGS